MDPDLSINTASLHSNLKTSVYYHGRTTHRLSRLTSRSYQRRDLYSHQSTTLCKSTDGEKKLRAKLNADNGWTITSKEFRKRTNIIKTEEKYSHKDQAAATKVEKKQSSQSASTEEAAAVCALVSTIKQVGDSIKALEVATLAAKQVRTLAFCKGVLMEQQRNHTEDVKQSTASSTTNRRPTTDN